MRLSTSDKYREVDLWNVMLSVLKYARLDYSRMTDNPNPIHFVPQQATGKIGTSWPNTLFAKARPQLLRVVGVNTEVCKEELFAAWQMAAAVWLNSHKDSIDLCQRLGVI